ncbi:MAG: VWA domain-containing protein [Deltaproteobacteria bacterium]|nr:VWA domain-containing protein [Deltaproteobacteria bacterium]
MSDQPERPLDPFDYLTILEPLFLVEPDFADQLYRELGRKHPPPSLGEVRKLVDHTLTWLREQPELGRAVAAGLLQLLGQVAPDWQDRYAGAVAAGRRITPVIGRSVAEKFVAVINARDENLLAMARQVVQTIGPWGPYPLGQVLNALLAILQAGDEPAARQYLRMVIAACRQGIGERELIRLAPVLSRALLFWPPEKRRWQGEQLLRAAEVDYHLATAFLRGMEKGVAHLAAADLRSFVDRGLELGDRRRRERYLALESRLGIDTCQELQVMVPLSAVTASLNRYLFARSGRPVPVRSLEHLPKTAASYPPGPCTDGRRIYLPAEMNQGATVAANQLLYRLLAGFDLACWEAGSFDFDRRRYRQLYPDDDGADIVGEGALADDLLAFLETFPQPRLAAELLNLVEQGRLLAFLRRRYPGFARQLAACLAAGWQDRESTAWPAVFWRQLFAALLLPPAAVASDLDAAGRRLVEKLADFFRRHVDAAAPVETAVMVMARHYAPVAAYLQSRGAAAARFADLLPRHYPYGHRLRFDLVALAAERENERADKLRLVLEEAGIDVFKADLKKLLRENEAALTPELLKKMVLTKGRPRQAGKKLAALLASLDLQVIFPRVDDGAAGRRDEKVPTFWYDEWSCQLNDYLRGHVKLLEHRRLGSDADFYPAVLRTYRGLVRRIRRNFELLRPENVQILRHWPEGDSFDYDALLEYAINRRLRLAPDDRFYRKRLKVERDVAVYLLVDVSSSTKNRLPDSDKTILTVEKEAMVLFCEALERVGDNFAIAGFSGSGRLAAEFFQVKDFAEPLDETVKNRLGALRPEKNTRMGPAVRHATGKLAAYPAKVKLLIILSDGLPNDQDYSAEYAIEDSRAAIREGRAKFVHVHAITVNAVNSPHLDRLYGDVHHTVIADVSELPDKLPRIYRSLTRQ